MLTYVTTESLWREVYIYTESHGYLSHLLQNDATSARSRCGKLTRGLLTALSAAATAFDAVEATAPAIDGQRRDILICFTIPEVRRLGKAAITSTTRVLCELTTRMVRAHAIMNDLLNEFVFSYDSCREFLS